MSVLEDCIGDIEMDGLLKTSSPMYCLHKNFADIPLQSITMTLIFDHNQVISDILTERDVR